MTYLNPRTMEKLKDLNPVVATSQEYIVRQDSDSSMPENVILQTRNYAMFKFDSLNRIIRQDKVDRLYDAIQVKNLLHLFPIIVNRDFVIIDGQHRFKVAEALNIPIYYIVSNQMVIEDAATVNTNVSKWTPTDYLAHWCNMGLQDYLWFRDFWNSNPFLTHSAALRLATYKSPMNREHRNHSRIFNEGTLQVTDPDFAIAVANAVRDFGRWIPFWRNTKFILALASLYAQPNYDHRRMMQKMEYLSARLVKCADIKDYLKIFEEIYNHKVHDENRVRFRSFPLRNKGA